MRPDIVEGTTLPDYELPRPHQHQAQAFTVAGRQSHDPDARARVLLPQRITSSCTSSYGSRSSALWALRGWSPITTDTFVQLNDLRLGVGADWPFLYDERRVIRQDLGHPGVYRSTQQSDDTAHLCVGARSECYTIYNGYWYWGRHDDE